MDCGDAQRIISEALDREQQAGADSIDEAKAHCRSCPECAAYVKALIEVNRLPLPQPPADLADRVIAAIRKEALETADVPTAPVDVSADRPVPSPPADETVMGRVLAYAREPRNRRTVALWATAAATLIVVSTVTAIDGIRQITSGSRSASQVAEESASTDLSVMSAAPDAGSPAEDAGGATVPPALQTAPPAIVVGEVVYEAIGVVAGIDPTTLTAVGSTRTSLDSGGTPPTREVLGTQDPTRVYVINDTDEVLAFERVVREYDGKRYSLSSGDLPAYGLWPSLPAGRRQPTNPNGMPEFVPAGEDAAGVEVYRSVSGGTDDGIAIAPGTSASDPAAGNPGWTWWAPIR